MQVQRKVFRGQLYSVKQTRIIKIRLQYCFVARQRRWIVLHFPNLWRMWNDILADRKKKKKKIFYTRRKFGFSIKNTWLSRYVSRKLFLEIITYFQYLTRLRNFRVAQQLSGEKHFCHKLSALNDNIDFLALRHVV